MRLAGSCCCCLWQKRGLRGVAADSGDEALEMVGAMTTVPDVVLADMQMLGTTGNALGERLRELVRGGNAADVR